MFKKEFYVPVIVLILSYAFLDPFMLLMPTPLVYTFMALFFIGYVAFALLVWRERPSDEREAAHRSEAGRIAYVAGAGVLVVGIIYQALTLHSVDPWLIVTLTVMVFAKYFALSYVQAVN